MRVQVHESALKRGLSVDEVIHMWSSGVDETIIDDDEPPRYMRLTFDNAGRPWELAALRFGNGARFLVIHAMPARKSVVLKMQRRAR
ncbi:MAG: toxin [Ancrocorticia sp.]|uniref:toxin n=1 Tax=Ancrocorticia sp. TaxID=2593684 RepID=UPI003F9230B8